MKLAHVSKPCVGCPFLKDGPQAVRLYRDRIHEIVSVIAPRDGQGGNFPCHKTVDYDDQNPRTELECAGALIFAYKQGASTQLTRILERLGMIDPSLAQGEHPEVFDDLDDMLASAIDSKPKRRKARAR